MTAKDVWELSEPLDMAIEKNGAKYYTNNSEFFKLLAREVKRIKAEKTLYGTVRLIVEI